MFRLPLALALLFALGHARLLVAREAVVVLHISAEAKAGGDGTREQPYATLEEARDALRKLADRGDAEVVIHGGRYFRDATFRLEAQDSRTTYRAAEGEHVVFDGGQVIPDSACEAVTDRQMLDRLPEEARGKQLLQVDLKKLGIADLGEFGPRGFRRKAFPAAVELFVDGQPLSVARWPNAGKPVIPLGEVIDSGSARRYNKEEPLRPGAFKYETPRAERWTQAEGLHLRGYFSNGFADDSIPVAEIDTKTGVMKLGLPHFYGVGTGKPPSVWGWHAENLLEEIDQSREYYLDHTSGVLYLLPPDGFEVGLGKHVLQVSQLLDPFVVAKGATDLRLVGLTFENSRGSGAEFSGQHVLLKECTFRNLGGHGVSLYGENNAMEGCRVIDLGAGGVTLSGGNRRTLEPGNNALRHCEIARVNRWYRTYKPAISLSGAGNFVQHCHLHHCPGQGIIMSGNDHLIEFNELGHLVSMMSDQGAIYMGRNPSCTGNVFRYNFIHHTKSHHAGFGNSGIFLDDGASGQTLYGNMFYKTGKNGAVKYHGGQFNTFINNVVIDCKQSVKYLLWDQQRWDIFLSSEPQVRNMLKSVNVLAPPYSIRYPQLAAIYRTPYSREPTGEVRNWVTTADDSLFADGTNGDFTITDYEKLREQVPGFAELPWQQIGPQPKNRRESVNPQVQADAVAAYLRSIRDGLNEAYDKAGRKRPLWLKKGQ